MENLHRVFISFVGCAALLFLSVTCRAGETQHAYFSWLDMLDQSYGPTESRCGLGFVGFGSPLVVTRVSSWTTPEGLTEADVLLAVNEKTIRRESDLNGTLKLFGPGDHVTLSVLRGGDSVQIDAVCQDVTSVLQARSDALAGAEEGRWDDCIKATYQEEFHWGGANSESAGLRLWCHQAQYDTAELTRIDAQFMYEHTNLLLDELKHVPGWIRLNHKRLIARIHKIGDSGYAALSAQLQARLSFIDNF